MHDDKRGSAEGLSRRAHSKVNKDLKKIGGEIYLAEGFKETGEEVKKTGQVASNTGNGINQVSDSLP